MQNVGLTRSATNTTQAELKSLDRGAHKCILMICYHFPPCTSIGMQRTLRFARHLPLFGWRPVVLTVRADDFIGEPVEPYWQHRVPTSTTIYRARVLRPLAVALKVRHMWQVLAGLDGPAPQNKTARSCCYHAVSGAAGSIRGSPP
jgi:hypothetical protein